MQTIIAKPVSATNGSLPAENGRATTLPMPGAPENGNGNRALVDALVNSRICRTTASAMRTISAR
jgi:hypothetical protein